jgi:hypothetical protein
MAQAWCYVTCVIGSCGGRGREGEEGLGAQRPRGVRSCREQLPGTENQRRPRTSGPANVAARSGTTALAASRLPRSSNRTRSSPREPNSRPARCSQPAAPFHRCLESTSDYGRHQPGSAAQPLQPSTLRTGPAPPLVPAPPRPDCDFLRSVERGLACGLAERLAARIRARLSRPGSQAEFLKEWPCTQRVSCARA